jgi:hypothetical protein
VKSIRSAVLSLFVALLFAPIPAGAQGPGSNINARVAALEAAVAALQSGQTQLNGRVGKLEGNVTAADFVGTYNVAAFAISLEGGGPAQVGVFTQQAVATLNASGTGHIGQQGSFISITEGNPWTKGTGSFGPEGIDITWSYANGILHLSDGTPNLDMDFVVGVGGRILTFVGLGDDGEAVLVIATRLQ